jgi:hypothetical protein
MAQIDTRHAEKDTLFKLFVAKYDPKNLDLQIANTMATMEDDDVIAVERRFEDWKNSLEKST